MKKLYIPLLLIFLAGCESRFNSREFMAKLAKDPTYTQKFTPPPTHDGKVNFTIYPGCKFTFHDADYSWGDTIHPKYDPLRLYSTVTHREYDFNANLTPIINAEEKLWPRDSLEFILYSENVKTIILTKAND